MKINNLLLTVLFLFGIIFVACNSDLENREKNESQKSTGIISGKVLYSNLNESQNAGIIVTLDKTDGLRTDAVTRSVAKRSIISSERTIVSNSVTRNDGSYLFENLEPGTYTVYAASSYSKEKAVCTNVVVRSAEETVADVMTLTATGSIKGKITLDEGNSGNTGFLVFIAGTSYMAITDDAGNYTISDVPAGNGYQLVAMKNNVMHFLENNVVVNANSSTTIATNNFTSKELKATDGKDGVDGTSIVWLGSFEDESEIENPQYLNAYFNMKDGCSYIYDGTKWTLSEHFYANELAIGTVLNTETLTNQNVIITVNINKPNILKIGYVYSSTSLNYTDAKAVLNSTDFISITQNVNRKYIITATLNGFYTIAVKDTEGFVTYTEEYVSNIDKTAPSTVSNLTTNYDRNTKKIYVTWTNPADTDFDYAVLGYTKGGATVTSNVRITNGIYSLNDVEVDGDEYVFTVYAKDTTGNASDSQTTNIVPSDGPKVQSITLSRYHWAYNDPDQTVTATAIISNADLIEDGTIVKFQIKDPGGNITNTVAIVDKSRNIAIATIIVPSSGYNNSSANYTVFCKIGDETADIMHTSRFNISDTAYLSDVFLLDGKKNVSKKQIALTDVNSFSKEIVHIEGYNLDLVKPYIQLYDSTDTPYFEQPIEVEIENLQWTETGGGNYNAIDTVIKVPTIDDLYTIKVLFDRVIQIGYVAHLQVYSEPKFSTLEIPRVSYTKEDNTVVGTIIGKNFDTPIIKKGNLIVSCPSNPSIVADTSFIINKDSSIAVTFAIPGSIGEYDITVYYGQEFVQGTLIVRDYSNYSVGDVLLNDGTVIPYEVTNLSFSQDQKKKAVSVLAYFNNYGVPEGIGIHNSAGGSNSNYYMWVPPYHSFLTEYFSEIICVPSEMYCPGSASTAVFNEDIEGADNWGYICSVDQVGTIDVAKNYPAFNYVNNYARIFGLTKEYEKGWYMPSLPELCYIYRNKDVLNRVLTALDGVQLINEYYWSSSLYSYYDEGHAWRVNFSDGYIDNSSNYMGGLVCCVHVFE